MQPGSTLAPAHLQKRHLTGGAVGGRGMHTSWRLQSGVVKSLHFQSAARTAEAVHLDLQARAAANRCVSWSGMAAVTACEVATSVGKKVPKRAANDWSAHCSTSQVRMAFCDFVGKCGK